VKGKTPFTLTEAIKVFEIAVANVERSGGATFWREIEKKTHIISNRSAESLRGFWKKHSEQGLEDFIRKALENNLRFSHMIKNIPEIKL